MTYDAGTRVNVDTTPVDTSEPLRSAHRGWRPHQRASEREDVRRIPQDSLQ